MIDVVNVLAALKSNSEVYLKWHEDLIKDAVLMNKYEDKELRYFGGKLTAANEFVKLFEYLDRCVTNNPGQEIAPFWERKPTPEVAATPAPIEVVEPVVNTVSIEG